MSQEDYAVFLIAGAVGALYNSVIAWGIVGVWALLKLLHVL